MLRGLRESGVKFVVVGGLAGAAHGSRRVTDVLEICYKSRDVNRSKLATVLATWNAYPRGVERGLPFLVDVRQIAITPLMTLATSEGFLDVRDGVKGVGDYEACRRRSQRVEAFDIRFRVLELPALIDSMRASGRPRDIDHIPELEALLALR